jgi:hypothetical protein
MTQEIASPRRHNVSVAKFYPSLTLLCGGREAQPMTSRVRSSYVIQRAEREPVRQRAQG